MNGFSGAAFSGMSITTGGTFAWVILAFAPLAALGAGWWVWRRTDVRDGRMRLAIAVLRGAFIFVALVLVVDPVFTRTVERLPRLAVNWVGGPLLDVRDAPDGKTRRESLESALDHARANGLGNRFEVAEEAADNSRPDDRAAAATLVLASDAGLGTEVGADGHTVLVVPPRDETVPDLSVLALELPARAVTGVPVEALATIRSRGAAGRTAVVTISDGTRVARSSSFVISGGDETVSVAFSPVLQSVGWRRLTVEVAGVTGEVSLADNRFDKWIELETRTRTVLFVESAPSWEGKFVRRALEKDATIRVDYATAVSKDAIVDVESVEGEKGKPEQKAKSTGDGPASLAAVLGDEKRLFGYDAVILGPLDATALSEAVATRLVRFVDDRGGGLIVLGGNSYAGSVLSSRGAFTRLLPADIPARSLNRLEGASSKGDGSVTLAPAKGFALHPAFAMLGDDPSAVLGKLQKMGGGYLRVGALAPGAEAIAVDGAAPSAEPLVVSHRYGAGRVTLVAPPDTWRLSVGATADLEDVSAKFWAGLLGWTAAGVREHVRVTAEPTTVSHGEPVRLVLEARGADWSARASTWIEGRAELETPEGETGDAETAIPLQFVADAADPGRFEAMARMATPGTWLVTVDVDGKETATCRVEVATGEGVVRPDPSADAAAEVALRATGGTVIRDGDADAIVEALGTPASVSVVETSRPARGIWWAFVLPLLFAGEAFLRRRSGADRGDVNAGELAGDGEGVEA